ncbi:DUF1203 domain-containing protein [Kribbella sp. NBC_00709]|uniref:DUF1203 domain-containing protein n=1 Tax=Kribbella sp. NBC_00709 TaxID=2975972 RepID=UPI002E2C067B|nr:DUF1203 domain-containing protein [Kribbella sp. NBC_00709]
MNTELRYEGVPGSELKRIRCNGYDDFGNAVVSRTSEEGGEPLRCCLTLAVTGAQITLVSHRPMTAGGPYAEVGPVFVHLTDCGGPAEDGFPIDYRDRQAVLRPYDAAGQMLDGVVAEPGTSETELKRLFEDPAVDTVQVRNVVAGCWNFTVRRQG